jgi:hypothetical protein
MFEKARHTETVKVCARRGPDGMVKPILAESKFPIRKGSGSDTTVEIRGLPDALSVTQTGRYGDDPVNTTTRSGGQSYICSFKGTKWTPTAVLNVNYVRNAGSPNSREAQGDGASVVVRGRESRPHGEGRQASQMAGQRRMRNAKQLKLYWTSTEREGPRDSLWNVSIVNCSTLSCFSTLTVKSTATQAQ